MLTKCDFCDYETCVALKELGYDDPTDLRYNDFRSLGDFLGRIKAPTLYEAQKWLREEKKIDVFVRAGYLGKNRVRHYFVEVFTSKDVITLDNDREDYDSYEEALSEGIKEAIKLLKEK